MFAFVYIFFSGFAVGFTAHWPIFWVSLPSKEEVFCLLLGACIASGTFLSLIVASLPSEGHHSVNDKAKLKLRPCVALRTAKRFSERLFALKDKAFEVPQASCF